MWALVDHHLDLSSPFHAWHPTPKLIGLGGGIVALACLGELRWAATGLAMSAGAVLLTNLPPLLVLKRMRTLLLFVVAFAVMVALTAGGERIAFFAALTYSPDGLRLAGIVACKALGIGLLAICLIATSPFARICESLRRIGVPARLVGVLMLVYRMNFALGGEVESIRAALAARGYRATASPRSLGVLGTAIGSLLVRSIERADRLHDAMQARGYDGRIRCLPGPVSAAADWIKAAVALVLALGLLGVDLTW